MENKNKLLIIILVLIGLIITGFLIISVMDTGNSFSDESKNNLSSTAPNTDYQKTDIAQIFITTGNNINKEDYTKASIVITDARSGSYDTIISKDAEIKIRGNSTARLDKLPYNIKLSSSQSVLGMKAGEKWSLLANYLDTSLMRDKLAYDFAENIGMAYSSESRYIDLWMNGEYQGNYLITVPIEAGENRVDINTENNEYLLELEDNRVEEDATYLKTDLCRFKLDAPETLTKKQTDWLTGFLGKAEDAMINGEFSEVSEYVDIDSFINFFIIQELFKNMDVHTSSTRYYIKDDKIYAGPIWDFDLTSGNIALFNRFQYYLVYNNDGQYGNSTGNSYEGFWALNGGPDQNYSSCWIGNLMGFKEFREKFYNRYVELQNQIINLYEDNAIGTNQIDLLLDQYGDSFLRDNEKWPVNIDRGSPLYRDNEKTFDESVTFLRSWLKSRNEWLLEALEKVQKGL